MEIDLRRLIVRHRNVAPMLSALLAGTDAKVRILDANDGVILDRDSANAPGGVTQRLPVKAERDVVGWVEGGRIATAVAAVLTYACSREADKRSLSQEALDRYRELNLIYDLAETIGATLEVSAVARAAIDEVDRLPGGGHGFLLVREGADSRLRTPAGVEAGPIEHAVVGEGILGAVLTGDPEIVNDVAADPRATETERAVKSLIAAPLKARGERIGIVAAAAREPIEFRASDLKLLAAIAALAGPAMDQSRRHEQAVGRTGDA